MRFFLLILNAVIVRGACASFVAGVEVGSSAICKICGRSLIEEDHEVSVELKAKFAVPANVPSNYRLHTYCVVTLPELKCWIEEAGCTIVLSKEKLRGLLRKNVFDHILNKDDAEEFSRIMIAILKCGDHNEMFVIFNLLRLAELSMEELEIIRSKSIECGLSHKFYLILDLILKRSEEFYDPEFFSAISEIVHSYGSFRAYSELLSSLYFNLDLYSILLDERIRIFEEIVKSNCTLHFKGLCFDILMQWVCKDEHVFYESLTEIISILIENKMMDKIFTLSSRQKKNG